MNAMKSIGYSILATLTFFTRLPLWRIADVPRSYYERVVRLWPLAGWVTGGIMTLTFYLATLVFPTDICILLAIVARLLTTGALHEDGLADFCDGFGGGTTKERTLEIMKDSHIGTYGVIGLIVYFALLFFSLRSLPHEFFPWIFLCADPLAKSISAGLVYSLPYARKESESKSKVVYTQATNMEKSGTLFLGLLPYAIICCTTSVPLTSIAAYILSYIAFIIMLVIINRRLKGYTGDCCGAICVVCELTFLLGIVILDHLYLL